MIDQRLKTFLIICKTMNFTKAAELLNMTQPAVTKHIQFLEQYYNAPLFKQKGRSKELTEEGKILYDYVTKMEAESLIVKRKITNSKEVKKHFSIGATLTTGEFVLPRILGEFKKEHRNYDVTMHSFNTDIVTKMLINGEIDLGLVEGPFDKTIFHFQKLMDDELVFAVSHQNEFGTRKEIEIEEVINSKLILREDGSGTRKVLENKLVKLGYGLDDLKPYMEVGSIGAIKSLVELNLGCTIISLAAIQKEIASKSLIVIPIKDVRIKRSFNFIYTKNSPEEFVDSFVGFSVDFITINCSRSH